MRSHEKLYFAELGVLILFVGAGFYVLSQITMPLPPSAVEPVEERTSVALAWDPSPDPVSEYRVYRGTNSGTYNWTNSAGTNLTYTVTNLSYGVTYFFAVTAVGTNNLESDYSNEVPYTPEPRPPALRLPQMVQLEVTYEGQLPGGEWVVLGKETVDVKTDRPLGLFRVRATAKQVDMIEW
jgi:hypothetical protein